VSKRVKRALVACIVVGGLVGGSAGMAGGKPPTPAPGDFTIKIDNRYWPMAPGSRWTYTETDEAGEVTNVNVTVTKETKVVDGVKTRVVHDAHTDADGALIEDTYDWFAQDRAGAVWYFGEDTKAFENGEVVSTEGSWEAGVDGALPGIAMPARPRVGLEYQQEHFAGVAEDAARVLSVDDQALVPFGHFTDVVMTKEFTPLDPEVLEYKLYAPGVGPVLMLGISGGGDREELVKFRSGDDD
jgi:hypothetical protein